MQVIAEHLLFERRVFLEANEIGGVTYGVLS